LSKTFPKWKLNVEGNPQGETEEQKKLKIYNITEGSKTWRQLKTKE
jgi:hypothetical protein